MRAGRTASRDYRLMVGSLFVAVVVTVAVCTAVSLVAISHSTSQTSEAIDAAITAYDRYLQQISAGDPWSRELAALDPDGLLDQMPGELAEVAASGDADMLAALLEPLQERIAEYEGSADGASLGRPAAGEETLYALFLADSSGQGGLLVGSAYAGPSAGCGDARLSQLDIPACLERDIEVTHLVENGDGTLGMAKYGEAVPGCILVRLGGMPALPGLEALSPISGITELYFIDSRGHVADYQGGGAYAGMLSFEALDAGGAPSAIVELDGGDGRYRAYYHDTCPGYTKFVLVTPDVAQQARRELMTGAVAAGCVLAALGCLLGAALTRRVYAPLRRVIARLAPLDHAEQDEFRLVALAIRTLERQLDEQAPAVEGYHLARILRGQAELPREAEGFFFGPARGEAAGEGEGGENPAGASAAGEGAGAGGGAAAGVVCAVVALRPDERCDLGALEAAVRERMEAAGRRCAVCQDAGMVVVVADASGGGVGQEAARLRQALEDDGGFLASAFASGARPAPDGIPACYREVLDMVELKGAAAFCSTLTYDADMPAAAPAGPGGQQPQAAPDFAAVLAYVQANYRDPDLSAGKLARVFGMAQPAVSRLFKRNGFDGFLTCLHGLRIAEAKRLLRDGRMSVQEVAREVGYGSAVTMTRAFKRYTGQTPGEFRER